MSAWISFVGRSETRGLRPEVDAPMGNTRIGMSSYVKSFTLVGPDQLDAPAARPLDQLLGERLIDRSRRHLLDRRRLAPRCHIRHFQLPSASPTAGTSGNLIYTLNRTVPNGGTPTKGTPSRRRSAWRLREAAQLRRRKSSVRVEAEASADDRADLAEARRVRAETDAIAAAWSDGE